MITTCLLISAGIICQRSPSWTTDPVVLSLPPMTQAQALRAEEWEAFCKPYTRVDRYGVSRYVYEHPGCEFGRTK